MVNGIVHREDIDNEMELDKEGCWVTYEYYDMLKKQLKQSEALLKASVIESEVEGE